MLLLIFSSLFMPQAKTYAHDQHTETSSSSYIQQNSTEEKTRIRGAEKSKSKLNSEQKDKTEMEEKATKNQKKLEPEPFVSDTDSTEQPKSSARSAVKPMADSTIVWEGEIASLGNVYYQLWSDGRAGVRHGNNIAQNATIKIPARLNFNDQSYDVVHIYEGAFKNNLKLKTLEFIGDSKLELIYKEAFTGCTNLEKVEFAKESNLLTIFEDAFRDCTNLKKFDLGTCRELKSIKARAFRGCEKLTDISFANCESLTEIGEAAFRYCKLTSLDFGDNSKLKTIGESAFRDCESLGGKTIRIPHSVTTINQHAFMNVENGYGELHHKKLAEVNGVLPSLTVEPIELPDEAREYESKVDSSKNKTLLHKAAKWLDNDRTQAEIRLDYGYNFDRLANVDIIFVMDHSSSMLIPTNVKKDNITYNFPRAYLTDDIVCDAAKMILDNSPEGYDNRVALVSFGEKEQPLYMSDFMETSQEVTDQISKNPACWHTNTNYDAGLQGAIDIFKKNTNPNRQQAVIFLSDGVPFLGEGIPPAEGLAQAQELRDKKINVYPIAMYAENGTTNALKNISYDEKTVYVADDTDSFEKIMGDVVKDVINHAEPLTAQLEDVLAKDFELPSGLQADFETSTDGGIVSASPDGRKIHWDLRGCAQGIAHTLKIKLKLLEGTEFSASGILPTNDSLKAIST